MPNSRRPRLRRILKWTGLVACVLIVVAWGVSLRRIVVRFEADVVVRLYSGGVDVAWADDQRWPAGRWYVSAVSPGGFRDGFRWPAVHFQPPPTPSWVLLPLWIPLLVVAIPTALLWHRDRRRIPPGHCRQCGYDLTGNESGVCSECGLPCHPEAGVK